MDMMAILCVVMLVLLYAMQMRVFRHFEPGVFPYGSDYGSGAVLTQCFALSKPVVSSDFPLPESIRRGSYGTDISPCEADSDCYN